MLKKILIFLLVRLPGKRLVLELILNLNTLSYQLIGPLATKLENGIHPKHRIMKYKEWFLDNIEPDQVVMDIGSNTGAMAELLSQKADFVYGIEMNRQFVRQAHQKYQTENVKYICADATKYDFSNCDAIDVITLSNVLEHIENRQEFMNHLVAKVRWKNPVNKKLLIRVPMINRDWLTIYKKELGLEYRLDKSHYIEYSLENFRDELKSFGFEPIFISVKYGEIYADCRSIELT